MIKRLVRALPHVRSMHLISLRFFRMRTFLCTGLVILFVFLAGCKKAEEKPADQPQQAKETQKAPAAQKNKARKKSGPPPFQVYKEDQLVVTIPAANFDTLTTTTVKVDGKDFKALLLADLLKKHNLAGKSVRLKGPNKASVISWDVAVNGKIYLYVFKNRLQVYQASKSKENIPVILMRVTVTDKAEATVDTGAAKEQKPAT